MTMQQVWIIRKVSEMALKESRESESVKQLKIDKLLEMSIVEMPNFSFKNCCWRYVGEGNCHIVISLPTERIVMRFAKYSQKSEISEVEEYDRYQRIALFHLKLICPLLSSRYSVIPVLRKISHSEIQFLNNQLLYQRPNNRMEKIIKFGFVEIYPDHTRLPTKCGVFVINHSSSEQMLNKSESRFLKPHYETVDRTDLMSDVFSHSPKTLVNSFHDDYSDNATFSVEIKPKQGWLSLTERKFPKCAFCMNQYIKTFSKNVVLSNYCPLDLFSGEMCRIKYAITCLLKTPQNNLRIFRNGQLVYGEGIQSDFVSVLEEWFPSYNSNDKERNLIDQFCHLIATALTNDDRYLDVNPLKFDKNLNYNCSNQYSEHLSYFKKYLEVAEKLYQKILTSKNVCNWSYKKLNKNCILNKILEIQKLDFLGLEAAYSFYQDHLDYNYIDRFISLTHSDSDVIHPSQLNTCERYILSTIAKDCSIFVTTKRLVTINGKSNVLTGLEQEKYLYNIAVVDIGPKPVSCISKHWLRNINIMNACLIHFGII